MILMDVKIDNFYSFSDFHMNMSYPKKLVNSPIDGEWLSECPTFRYKKVNILMGANATGKTSFGRILTQIYNFIIDKELKPIAKSICNSQKPASFSVDIVTNGSELKMTRVRAQFDTPTAPDDSYGIDDVHVDVASASIKKGDTYETCAKRLDEAEETPDGNYIEKLSEVEGKLAWVFSFTDEISKYYPLSYEDDFYLKVLERTMKVLDPDIIAVKRLEEVKNALVVRMRNETEIILKERNESGLKCLSSGTRAGISIAPIVASISTGKFGFYYCDEMFAYVSSEVEKTFLSMMIHGMQEDTQLFFTTHNTEVLDLPLPKHSFTFLRKDVTEPFSHISCVYASDFLKRNTDSLRCAYENDLFRALPDVDDIYSMAEETATRRNSHEQ